MRTLILVAAWAASVTSPDPRERARAASDLRRSAARPEALRTLVKLLGDADSEVRAVAADSIGDFDADAQPAVRALMQCLQDPAERVRERAAHTLGRIGPGAAEAIPYLLPLLTDGSYGVRWQGVQALGGIGPAAAATRSHILALWNDENEYVRGGVVTALSSIANHPQEAYPYLVPALRDPSVNVRRAAASGLSQWAAGSAAVLPEIRRALRDADSTVRGAAMGALFRMPKREAEGFVEDMMEALNDPANHFGNRSAAADFLGGMGQAAVAAAPDLRHALNDPHDWVRRAASRALRRLGLPLEGPAGMRAAGQASSPVAVAAAKLSDPEANVRIRALHEMVRFEERVTPWAGAVLGRLAAGTLEEKQAAIAVLGGIRTPPAGVVTAMVAALSDTELRGDVLRAFSRMGPGAAPAIPALVKILEGGDPQWLGLAIRAVGDAGPAASAAAPVLGRLLSGGDSSLKRTVLYALNHIGSGATEALPALYAALDDRDSAVSGDAAFAVGQVFVGNGRCVPLPPEAGARLVALLSDSNTETRRHAGYALSWARPVPKGAAEALQVAIADTSFEVRGQAARALARAGGSSAVTPLIGLLSDPSWQVRQDAVWALGELRASARPALPALRQALSDSHLEVRRAAQRAIDAIER